MMTNWHPQNMGNSWMVGSVPLRRLNSISKPSEHTFNVRRRSRLTHLSVGVVRASEVWFVALLEALSAAQREVLIIVEDAASAIVCHVNSFAHADVCEVQASNNIRANGLHLHKRSWRNQTWWWHTRCRFLPLLRRSELTLWLSHQSTFGLPVRPAAFSTWVGLTCNYKFIQIRNPNLVVKCDWYA